MPNIQRYFGHFSPKLRFFALEEPRGVTGGGVGFLWENLDWHGGWVQTCAVGRSITVSDGAYDCRGWSIIWDDTDQKPRRGPIFDRPEEASSRENVIGDHGVWNEPRWCAGMDLTKRTAL